jgi:hypothetical protein
MAAPKYFYAMLSIILQCWAMSNNLKAFMKTPWHFVVKTI